MQILKMLKFQILLILTYNVTKSAIKSKLKNLLSELRGFKFVTALVSALRKIESEDKTKYDNFHSGSKGEINNYQSIDDVFESMLQLYQTYKNLYEMFQAGLLIESFTIALVFQSRIP